MQNIIIFNKYLRFSPNIKIIIFYLKNLITFCLKK